MLKISFTNAEVSDHGYGLEVNGKSLEDIISTALGTKLSDVCGGYRVLRALYNLSRIPERYRYTIALKPENGEDLEAFTTLDNYKNDVLSMVDEGRGLYIWGKSTGNGKTSWACKIMSYFFRKIAFNTGLENEGLYIFLPTFLEDLRDNYDNKDPEFDEVLRMIKTCRLLIIDNTAPAKERIYRSYSR